MVGIRPVFRHDSPPPWLPGALGSAFDASFRRPRCGHGLARFNGERSGVARPTPPASAGTLSITHTYAIQPVPGLQSTILGNKFEATYRLHGPRWRSRFAPPRSYIITGRGHEDLNLHRSDLYPNGPIHERTDMFGRAFGDMRLVKGLPSKAGQTGALLLRLLPEGGSGWGSPRSASVNTAPATTSSSWPRARSRATGPPAAPWAAARSTTRGSTRSRRSIAAPTPSPSRAVESESPTHRPSGASTSGTRRRGATLIRTCAMAASSRRSPFPTRISADASAAATWWARPLWAASADTSFRGICIFAPRGPLGTRLPEPDDGYWEACNTMDTRHLAGAEAVFRWSFRPTG